MSKPKVIIATPIHRQPHPRMEASRKLVMATAQKAEVSYMELRNESLISRARNTLLASFVATNADFLYFWDDDIEALNIGGDQGNLIDMLVSHDLPMVGGLYATRGIGGHCSARVYKDDGPRGRLWSIRYLAGGSILVRRDAVNDMITASPELEYETRSNCGTDAPAAWALFQPFIDCGEYLSEDYAFCQRWLNTAGMVHADLDVRLWHWGEAAFSVQDPRQEPPQ